jgi:hypothetical protein
MKIDSPTAHLHICGDQCEFLIPATAIKCRVPARRPSISGFITTIKQAGNPITGSQRRILIVRADLTYSSAGSKRSPEPGPEARGIIGLNNISMNPTTSFSARLI